MLVGKIFSPINSINSIKNKNNRTNQISTNFKLPNGSVSFTSNSNKTNIGTKAKHNLKNVHLLDDEFSPQKTKNSVIKMSAFAINEATAEKEEAENLVRKLFNKETFDPEEGIIVSPETGEIFCGVDSVSLAPLARKIKYDPKTGEIEEIATNYFKSSNFISAEKIYKFSKGNLTDYLENYIKIDSKSSNNAKEKSSLIIHFKNKPLNK